MLPSSVSELVIANFSIENRGYDTFATNKNYFSAVVKGTSYSYDSSCYANELLPDTEITNGNAVKGNVPYTLPELTMNPDIIWHYVGPEQYNIKWVNLGSSPPVATQTTP